MRLKEIVELLESTRLTDVGDMDRDIAKVHASDLISEVLASCTRGALWVTGLMDIQLVNTVELFDLAAVVFVENRKPPKDVIDAAVAADIPLLMTHYTTFETCGLLYQEKLVPAKRCK